MGKLVEELAPQHGFAVALRLGGADNREGAGISAEAFRAAGGIDVAIDFSTAAAVPIHVARLVRLGVPVVVGATGWGEHLEAVRATVERHAAEGAGLLYGANFSLGVQVFYRLARAAAELLAGQGDYDAWLYEIHHKKKRDAPSGTLLELKRTMERSGYERPIDVASNRAGAVPGTHQIGFDSDADTILLEHRARNRAGFAHGALRAARWIIGRRGFYEFSQVWEEVARQA
jgi:4-hydroxy-tetrahydrodipicolinate reductase